MTPWHAKNLFVIFLCVFYAIPAPGVDQEELAAVERAHAATDEVRANFKKALKEALTKGGPAKALPSCKIIAPKMAEKKSGADGEIVAVGRTSHRTRNPKNAPNGWVKPYLEKFASAKTSDIPKYEIVKLGDRHYGYMEPIFVESICLNCHGSNLTQDVRDALHKEYPDDKAIGFKLGDFRGLLWIEMKK